MKEGKDNILVGAADEHIPILDHVKEEFNMKQLNLTNGASFFVMGKEGKVRITGATSSFNFTNVGTELQSLGKQTSLENIDAYFVASSNPSFVSGLKEHVGDTPVINYLDFTGVYPSASAFATHLANDIIANQVTNALGEDFGSAPKKIIIMNNLMPKSLGMILLERNEA